MVWSAEIVDWRSLALLQRFCCKAACCHIPIQLSKQTTMVRQRHRHHRCHRAWCRVYVLLRITALISGVHTTSSF